MTMLIVATVSVVFDNYLPPVEEYIIASSLLLAALDASKHLLVVAPKRIELLSMDSKSIVITVILKSNIKIASIFTNRSYKKIVISICSCKVIA